MSGPKVVRVVTREEVIAICEGHLARLDQAASQWREQGERIGELNAAEVAATHARCAELRAMLARDAFAELQRLVPIEIGFLQQDLLQREERAVQKAIEVRQRQRRIKENAATLLKTLQARRNDVPASLLQEIESVANGTADDSAGAILARGFDALVPAKEGEQLTDGQRELAAKLNKGNATLRVAEWRAQYQVDTPRDPRLELIDRHIAELQTLDASGRADDFLDRLKMAEQEARGGRRNLLLDSLVLDLAKSVKSRQQHAALFQQLHVLAAEVQQLHGDGATKLLAEIANARVGSDASVASQLIEECRTTIAVELQQRAALSRRQAILGGLATLGYEVREGMATAWAKDGSVVLRKTATPGYGVELAGSGELGRLQVRAVALSQERDTRRDRDIETIWCGEFQRLQSLLTERGDDLAVERMLPIGSTPLKLIRLEVDKTVEARASDVGVRKK